MHAIKSTHYFFELRPGTQYYIMTWLAFLRVIYSKHIFISTHESPIRAQPLPLVLFLQKQYESYPDLVLCPS